MRFRRDVTRLQQDTFNKVKIRTYEYIRYNRIKMTLNQFFTQMFNDKASA